MVNRGTARGLVQRFPVVAAFLLALSKTFDGLAKYELAARGALWRRRFGGAGWNLQIGRNTIIRGRSRIRLGNDVTIYDGVVLNAGDEISIGSRSHIDVQSCIYGHGGVHIGECCAIAAGVRIYSQTNTHQLGSLVPIVDQPRKYARVWIGNDVWIGTNAVVLPGVRIEDHSVVAAGAVVTRDVPRSAIVGGVPARILAYRE